MARKKKSALEGLMAAFGPALAQKVDVTMIKEPEPKYDEFRVDATKRTALLMVQSLPLKQHVVLREGDKPRPSLTRKCVECGDVFRTDYIYDTYCSYSCLAKVLKEDTGIVFDPRRLHWDFNHQPSKLNPQATQAMYDFCLAFIAEVDQTRSEAKPETSEQSAAQAREKFLDRLDQDQPDQSLTKADPVPLDQSAVPSEPESRLSNGTESGGPTAPYGGVPVRSLSPLGELDLDI